MKKSFAFIVAAAAIASAFFYLQKAPKQEIGPRSKPRVTLDFPTVNAKPLQLPLKNPSVLVAKKKRQLHLYSDGKVVRNYPIGLGGNPEGHKQKEGDRRTPEGRYFICGKNSKSKFLLSLGISYPNASDAKANRDKLTEPQYNEVVLAESKRRQPPWNTPLGGEIMIHGRGSDRDWTLGCVALDDPDIVELFGAIEVGVPVTIEP